MSRMPDEPTTGRYPVTISVEDIKKYQQEVDQIKQTKEEEDNDE